MHVVTLHAPLHADHRAPRGFTLIELLISMVLGVIILAVSANFAAATLRTSRGIDLRDGLNRDARFVGLAIARDLQDAGVAFASTQPFGSVAEVVGKSADATRQIAVRARRKVRTDEAGVPRRAGREHQLAVAAEFVAAVVAGDEDRVRALVTNDSVLVSDGGARRHAARRPVVGPERIARFLVNIYRRFMAIEGHEVTARSCWINGSPGVVVSIDSMPYWVAAFDVRDGQVDRLHATLNPDKLTAVDRIIDLV